MAALRRLVLLVALLGATTAGYVWWKRRDDALELGAPEWPPLPSPEPQPASAPAPVSTAEPAATWIEPVDGACPATHPVKLNETSGIFHLPGGRFYERTNADRCYTSAEAAVADGYRASKA